MIQRATRCALYARVSTTGQSVAMQIDEMREYCERRGFEISEIFVDRGVSGSRDRRPALDRLMADAHRRKFDALLVWKLDRFGRSLRHLVTALAELEARRIAFVSLRDNLDLSTPGGRLMFQVIGAMAEFERSLIVERVRAGLDRARRRGKRLGKPSSLNLPEVARLTAAGLSRRKVAKQLGVTARSIQRALARVPRRAGDPANTALKNRDAAEVADAGSGALTQPGVSGTVGAETRRNRIPADSSLLTALLEAYILPEPSWATSGAD